MSVPANVTVAVGSTSAYFTINCTGVASTTYVTISAACNKWCQSVSITALPLGYTPTVQNLQAFPGNGCVLLYWTDIAESSAKRFEIVRRLTGTSSITKYAWQPSSMYADTGLTNGVSYDYQVWVVNVSNHVVSTSAWISVSPVASVAGLNWINPPATASGVVTLSASLTVQNVQPAGLTLLIDGNATAAQSVVASSTPVQASLDTSYLPDGFHTVQLFGMLDGATICATTPLLLQISNNASALSCDAIFDPSQGEFAAIKAFMPSGSTNWVLQIISDDTGAVVRTWSSTTLSIHLSWDGMDETGASVPDGGYSAELTCYDQQANGLKARTPLTKISGSPNALILISYLSVSSDKAHPFIWDDVYAANIKASLNVMKTNNPGFSYVIMKGVPGQPLSTDPKQDKKSKLKMRGWLQNSVTDFYLFAHGTAAGPVYGPTATFAGINFWPNNFGPNDLFSTFEKQNPQLHFIIPHIVGTRQYNFVWMDNCNSADGRGNNTGWEQAFNIGTDQNFSSAFLGWNSTEAFNVNDNGSVSVWLYWRENVWARLARGNTVAQALQYADGFTYNTSSTISPWDAGRRYLGGDTWLP